MKTKLLGLIATIAMLGVSQASADTVYNVSDTAGTLSVSGTITTDGNIGVLALSDIVAWNLTVSGYGVPFSLTTGNSVKALTGSDLTATSTALLFYYSDAASGDFTIGSGSCAPCGGILYASSGYNSGGSGFFQIGDYQDYYHAVQFNDDRLRTQVIANVAATPLPAALPLFASGLGTLGLLGWRRKRKAQAAA